MRTRHLRTAFVLFASGIGFAACATGTTDAGFDDGFGGSGAGTGTTTSSTGTTTWTTGTTTSGTTTSGTTTSNTTTSTWTTSGTTTWTTSTTSTTSGTTSTTSTTTTTSTTSTTGTCSPTDLVVDGGFELGIGAGSWAEFSTNFGTPLCDGGCGGTLGPYAGTYYAWFGGFADGVTVEEGDLQQNVVIGVGTATLRFRLAIPSCEDPLYGADYFAVGIDGVPVWETDNTDPSCGVAAYTLVTVPLSAYADGQSHLLEFYANTLDVVTPTSFFVDNVELIGCP